MYTAPAARRANGCMEVTWRLHDAGGELVPDVGAAPPHAPRTTPANIDRRLALLYKVHSTPEVK